MLAHVGRDGILRRAGWQPAKPAPHKGAVYQGTSSVAPKKLSDKSAFSPCPARFELMRSHTTRLVIGLV